MNEIRIFFTKIIKKLPGHLYKKYIELLPDNLQEKNLKFYRWQDQHAHLFGKVLLLEGLKTYDIQENILGLLKYNKYSRPSLSGDIDFNISHSGEYVVCAFGKGLKLGIDIEQVKIIDLHDFKITMTPEQWNYIFNSSDPCYTFFRYWTIKESVIKADSRGLSVPLTDLIIERNRIRVDKSDWFLKEVDFKNDYCMCLACNKSDINLNMYELDIYTGNSNLSEVKNRVLKADYI